MLILYIIKSTQNPKKLQAVRPTLGTGHGFLIRKSYIFSLSKRHGLELKKYNMRVLEINTCSVQRYVSYLAKNFSLKDLTQDLEDITAYHTYQQS